MVYQTMHCYNKKVGKALRQAVGNKQKQTEDRKPFVISNIVSIVSYPSKKTDQNEVNAIQDLLQYGRSIAYCQEKRASTKRGHLIAQVKNTAVKWSIKPCIFRTKKIRSSVYRQRKRASTKRGHLIARVKNTSVKWAIKPCIVTTKKLARH